MVKEEILFVFGAARSGTTYMNQILYKWFDHGMLRKPTSSRSSRKS